MSRWFRHYAGMMRDDKLVRAAVACKQPIERVVWVWGAILESAAEVNSDGRFDVDAAEIAYFLRTDEADIRAIQAALTDAGRLAEGAVVKWGERQFQSDRSAARQAAYRERKRSVEHNGHDHKTSGDVTVTAASRHGDAPETETETETEKKIPTPNGVALFDERPSEPPDPSVAERDYFQRCRQVLGSKSGGGLGARLLRSRGGNVALARAGIEQASTKDKPAEYVGRLIHGPQQQAASEYPAGIV